VWTEVIRYVSRGQPSAIAVDIVFSGEDKSGTTVDSQFADVLHASGKSALAFAFMSTQMTSDDANTGEQRQKLLRSQGTASVPNFLAEEWVANLRCNNWRRRRRPRFSNSTPDQGGMIRRTPLQIRFAGLWLSFSDSRR
jgi:hypothetical protein